MMDLPFKITLIRDASEWESKAYVSGNKVNVPYKTDVQVGDHAQFDGWPAEQVVRKVEPFAPPGGPDSPMAHKRLLVCTLQEWANRQVGRQQPTTVQNIGSAFNVAGRDVNVNITAVQLLTVLQKAIEADKNIPAEQKASLLQKVGELASNPYVSGLATAGIWDMVKSLFGG
jgi:hypothetical protein